MMKIFFTNIKKNQNRKAITFVELMVCILVASLVFKVVFDFMSNTRHNYMYGVVNLQNLQEARFAINCLRRDFASSCPKFKDSGESGYVNFQKLRKQLFATQNSGELNDAGELIQVTNHDLLFHKFIYGSFDQYPRVEKVTYQFDPSSKTLVRYSDTKGNTIFKGFEEVKFALYTHEINPEVPLLWVKFRINESSNIYGSDSIGNALELTTTISSSFISSSQNNKYWRFETGHKHIE